MTVAFDEFALHFDAQDKKLPARSCTWARCASLQLVTTHSRRTRHGRVPHTGDGAMSVDERRPLATLLNATAFGIFDVLIGSTYQMMRTVAVWGTDLKQSCKKIVYQDHPA